MSPDHFLRKSVTSRVYFSILFVVGIFDLFSLDPLRKGPYHFTDSYLKSFKILSLMLTFGILFIISCFSMYNIYWRTVTERNSRFEFEISYLPGMLFYPSQISPQHNLRNFNSPDSNSEVADKPPAYEDLKFHSPPPKYESIVHSTVTPKDVSDTKYDISFL